MIHSYYHAPDIAEGSDRMRGSDEQTSGMFSYLSPEQRVRQDHPLRRDPTHDGRGPHLAVAALQQDVLGYRSTVDSAQAALALDSPSRGVS